MGWQISRACIIPLPALLTDGYYQHLPSEKEHKYSARVNGGCRYPGILLVFKRGMCRDEVSRYPGPV